MKASYGVDAMCHTAENFAGEHQISRTDQDAFAYRSQRRCKAAQERGFFDREIVKVCVKKGKTETIVEKDEHPRGDTTMEILAKLPAAFRDGGSVTAGNSSGINDAACAMIIASEAAAKANGLTPRARILATVSAGVPPRVMGIGPVPATQKLLAKLGMTVRDMRVFLLNAALDSMPLWELWRMSLWDLAENVNPMAGHRARPSAGRLGRRQGSHGPQPASDRRRARSAPCIGVGQGIALALEQVSRYAAA
jgi:acetyl-CoA acetyltransferase family protein